MAGSPTLNRSIRVRVPSPASRALVKRLTHRPFKAACTGSNPVRTIHSVPGLSLPGAVIWSRRIAVIISGCLPEDEGSIPFGTAEKKKRQNKQSLLCASAEIPGNQIVRHFSIGADSAFLREGFQIRIIDFIADVLKRGLIFQVCVIGIHTVLF